MTMPMSEQLTPVRAALLRWAETEAARLRAEAATYRDTCLAAARNRAEEIRSEARGRGQSDAATLVSADLAANGRAARQIILSARRDAYRGLCRDVREQAAAWLAEPAARKAFQHRAEAVLGAGATLNTAPGGLSAAAGGRRLEITADALADAAVRELGSALEELWRP